MTKNDVGARFLVFGDSHTGFFDGNMAKINNLNIQFEIYHLGAVLATSLVERQSTLMAREKVLDILRQEKDNDWAGVIFSCGEIDCRFHIIRRLGHKNAQLTDAVRDSISITVLRYISFIKEVKLLGYCPIIWGPVASNFVNENPEYPNYGTTIERNLITSEFSSLLYQYCVLNKIDYMSIFHSLITEAMETKREYYQDGVHLGHLAWRFALPLFWSWLVSNGYNAPFRNGLAEKIGKPISPGIVRVNY